MVSSGLVAVGGMAARLPVAHALIVSCDSDLLWPGQPVYEHLFGRYRSPRVMLYGLITPLGVVPEDSMRRFPELFAVARQVDRPALLEATVRTRAWLDENRQSFERLIVVAGHGAMREVWTQAVRGARKTPPLPGLGEQVKLVKTDRRTGLRSLGSRLERAMPPSALR